MLNNYMAIIFLAESLDNIRSLTKMRPLASLPVGGTYRIIDFSLSNLVNAGIRNVGIFGGNEDLNSLTDHIGRGTEWDLDRKKDGIFIFKQMADSTYSTNIKRVKRCCSGVSGMRPLTLAIAKQTRTYKKIKVDIMAKK